MAEYLTEEREYEVIEMYQARPVLFDDNANGVFQRRLGLAPRARALVVMTEIADVFR